MARVVDLRDGAHARRDRLDRHDHEDRLHVRRVARIGGEDQRRARVTDPGPFERLGIGRVAADVVGVAARRVLLQVGDDHDLELVVVAAQFVEEVARGRVPAADDDVIPVARRSQSLSLLEQEVDDHGDEGAGDRAEQRDAEEDQQPVHDPPAGRRDEGGIADAEHR